MRKVSLDFLTIADVKPPEQVEIASALGYDAISPLLPGMKVWNVPPVMPGSVDAREMARQIEQTGMALHNIEVFNIAPDADLASYRPFLELGAELGAKNAVSIVIDNEPTRGLETFCRLCEDAASFGLNVCLEFFPMKISAVKTLDDAVAFLGRAKQSNVGLQIDLLHLMKSGGTPADILRIDPALIGSAQLCDGPAKPTDKQYNYNAVYERQLPGEGELPVIDFLRALPENVTVGLEIPLTSLAKQGISPQERAKRCLEAGRRMIDRAI